MISPLGNEVAQRFGVLPNFFRLGAGNPAIAQNLWGFAQFGYLDNPLPSLFKERLFVYLSRFCEVRYCIARHVGFLAGLGKPAGDAACLPQSIEEIVALLRRPLPQRDDLLPWLAKCQEMQSPLLTFPAPGSQGEQALFACATHVFLQSGDAAVAHCALRQTLGDSTLEHLNVLLAFVRTAHYWTMLHPELALEADVMELLATHETLAQCILKDSEAAPDNLSEQVAADLASLRTLRKQHETISQAYRELSIDHQYIKHDLHETRENLRELVSAMPAAVYALDGHGVLTYYNPKAVELWGRTPGLNDPPWFFLNSCRIYRMNGEVLTPEHLPCKKVLATGAPIVNCQLMIERPDSSRIYILANITALRDASGVVNGVVSIVQDITELKRIQQDRELLLLELERSNRELSEFSYAVAHDLSAPVRNVRNLTQLLVRRDGALQSDSSQVLSLIEKATTGMNQLIGSLLRYAQAGQGGLDRREVPLDHTITAIRATLSQQLSSTGGQIVCGSLPSVDADPILIEQLLQNLIANALQYQRPGVAPMVEILEERSEKGWQFAVKDNGQGIPVDFQEFVFEPLKRLHGDENPGTGLGLALCRTIVSRHGGRIWVESEGPGCGSTFRFTLGMVRKGHFAPAHLSPGAFSQ